MSSSQPTSCGFVPSFRGFLCLLCFLCLLTSAADAQQAPVDPAEISRELLYHPARQIETTARGLIFRAAQFTCRFDPTTGQWEVRREVNAEARIGPPMETYKSERLGVEYHFASPSSDDEGILEIRRGAEPQPLARLHLWNRGQVARAWLPKFRDGDPALTVEKLARELEPAGPEVSQVADDGNYLWLAIRFYAGEGSLGIGTVVRLDPQTNETKVYQPRELATSSVTSLVAAGGALWLSTYHHGENEIQPTVGLVRFDPATGQVRSYLPESSRLVGHIVTALRAEENFLWVATDVGMCRIGLPEARAEDWTCWRIVPTVRLAEPAPVSNRPGAPSGGQLPAGSYEVRWANAAFFEVVTPDWIEGWVAADDFEDYARRRHFDEDPYLLGSLLPSVMRLLAKPGSDPLAGAQVYRAPLERIGSASEGWRRVRAHIGWISRKGLDVTPVIRPVSPGPAPPQ